MFLVHLVVYSMHGVPVTVEAFSAHVDADPASRDKK
jgi:hypothetical protein